MAEPVLDRREPDLAQLLLREADEALTRARELLALGSAADQVILGQEFAAAGEAFMEAGQEFCRRGRGAPRGSSGGSHGVGSQAAMRWVP